MAWTEKHIKQLAAAGKIKGFTETRKKYSSNTPINIPNPKPAAVIWLDMNIQYWCNERLLTLESKSNGKEHRFDTERKWRFDYAIPSLKIAVEYEGIYSADKSRHTTVKGYTGDTEKYNRAVVLGWKVIRVTAKNYKTVIDQLNEMVK